MQRVWLETIMPFHCEAQCFARDGEPLRRNDEWWLRPEVVFLESKPFEEQEGADRWCTAWNRCFRVLDWCGQAGWIYKRRREDTDSEDRDLDHDSEYSDE